MCVCVCVCECECVCVSASAFEVGVVLYFLSGPSAILFSAVKSELPVGRIDLPLPPCLPSTELCVRAHCVCVCVRVCDSTLCVCVCVCLCVSVCLCACMGSMLYQSCSHACMCRKPHTYTNTHKYTFTHTHANTHMQIHRNTMAVEAFLHISRL